MNLELTSDDHDDEGDDDVFEEDWLQIFSLYVGEGGIGFGGGMIDSCFQLNKVRPRHRS